MHKVGEGKLPNSLTFNASNNVIDGNVAAGNITNAVSNPNHSSIFSNMNKVGESEKLSSLTVNMKKKQNKLHKVGEGKSPNSFIFNATNDGIDGNVGAGDITNTVANSNSSSIKKNNMAVGESAKLSSLTKYVNKDVQERQMSLPSTIEVTNLQSQKNNSYVVGDGSSLNSFTNNDGTNLLKTTNKYIDKDKGDTQKQKLV